MANIRSVNEIILNMLDALRISQPQLDTKPGTVSRDLLIDLPATQLALLYDEIAKQSNLQSLRLVSGSDLDKLAANYGLSRKQSVKSSGIVLFTFSSLPAIVSLNKGDLVFSINGSSFAIANGQTINPSSSNLYRSIATKFKNDLDFLGIKDQFAVEASIVATSPGSAGNLAKYSINKTSIPGVSNVTNIFPFTGGNNQEDDASFRNRALSIFSGSNIGTALGYKSLALSDDAVTDALVIEPGDPLMTRDGTQVVENDDGSKTIISEGTGGKVDLILLGNRLAEFIDSFIYQDASNINDPTNAKNDKILGQIPGDENKTLNRRRIDDIKNATLPAQPVEEIIEISGSLSGSNFAVKEVDTLGRVSGNFELVKDTSTISGSPFGFDKLHWISDHISLFQEDRVKGKFNGQDNLTFTDVLNISKIQQNITIINENSTVLSDRSFVQVLHTPATNILRVLNTTTGERYVIVDQNPDGDTSINTTGRIQISGNTLPSVSDILQVDYTWVVDYDPYVDYDGRFLDNNIRTVQDSIDWGISNAINQEKVLFSKNTSGTFYAGTVQHQINAVLACERISLGFGVVSTIVGGTFSGRKSVSLIELDNDIDTIDHIFLLNTNKELYNTAAFDGTFSSQRVVVGPDIKYNITIILPTDVQVEDDQSCLVQYNNSDVFTSTTATGNFVGNQITIPVVNITDTSDDLYLYVSYIANVQDLISTSIGAFPLSRFGNGFISSSVGFSNSIATNILRQEAHIVQNNVLSQPSITLDITATDFNLGEKDIISVIRISDQAELWNDDNVGVISTNTSNNYVLTFNGVNAPIIGNNVIAIYKSNDIRRVQPFSYQLQSLKNNVDVIQFNSINDYFYVPFQSFTNDVVDFEVIDPVTNEVIDAGSDGILVNVDSLTATLTSVAVNFSNISELNHKYIRIRNSLVNNNGQYYVSSVDLLNNKITITSYLNNIINSQVSITRILDGKEIWTSNCSIDLSNNILILPSDTDIDQGDDVFITFYNFKNLKQSPTRIILTAFDTVNSSGVLTLNGTSISKATDIIFTATANGLEQNLLEATKKHLNVASSSSISSAYSIVRIVKLEKVNVFSNEVLSVDATYNLLGTRINNNIYYADEHNSDVNLSNMEFILPSTENNTDNEPQIGDKLRVTFYYTKTNDTENIVFTKNGSLYTNKFFTFINKAFVSSGFTISSATRMTLSYFNQPITGSRYSSFYDYTAPKQNERITVRYSYNQLISDITFLIEKSRPINADILVKEAKKILVDLTVVIVLKPEFVSSEVLVKQNVQDKLTVAINTNKLNDILDASDLISVAQAVDGVDRTRVLAFNRNGEVGQVLSIEADKDEYFVANNVVVNSETR